ncbi:MAG: phosphotransferase [Patescibacteria group bacterium]|nr:phosphotransferase [Patescibacteria group bacterium]MBU1876779.1 phosphotransferase [Patescibacteria group bacterium]
MNILIPNIEAKIDKKLKSLQLSPQITPYSFFKKYTESKHRYFSPCKNQEGNLFGFYARCHNNEDAKKKFIQEINFLNSIKKTKLSINNSIPKIIKWKKENDFEWMLREYVDGKAFGSSAKLAFPIQRKTINQLVLLISEIKKIKLKQSSNLKLKKFTFKNYLSKSFYADLTKKKIISSSLSKKSIKNINSAMPLLEKENRYVSQGDLNLDNIIIDEKNNPWLIDWELIHLNNFAYDIGCLWAHLWEAKKEFRQKLMLKYIKHLNKNELLKFKKLLPIVVSYLSLGEIYIKHSKEKKTELEKRKIFYIRLLTNCFKNFEELIKT